MLGFIVAETDIEGSITLVSQIGFGFLLVLALYFAAFLIDTITWQLTLPSVPLSPVWIYRFFQMRLAGEAFNNITPAAGMGGEPVKAVLLKNHHEIAYRDGVASLILAKTINVLSLIVFLAAGFLLINQSEKLEPVYKFVSGVGLAAFALGVLLFFLIQRFKVTSATGSLVNRGAFARFAQDALIKIHSVEDKLVLFYSGQPARFLFALVFAFGNWVLGVAEVYYAMKFLGHPISLADAWIIESVAQLVRAGTFFIPASLGVQEGAFILIGASITGSPTVGFSMAVIRRLREIIWIVWGMVVFYLMKPETKRSDPGSEPLA